MTGAAHAVPLDLSVVRRNRLSPGELDRLVEPDLGAMLGLVRDRHRSAVKRIDELCERIHTEVPRRVTSGERGRLLKARRRLHSATSDRIDVDAVRRALDSLADETELVDAVADARDDLEALATAHDRVRDAITARVDTVATHGTELLRREPIASTLAISSPAFTEALMRGPIPADPEHRSFRTATSFLKRAAMKTSPFGRFTEMAVGDTADLDPTGTTRVAQPRTLSTRLLLAAVDELSIDPNALVHSVIGRGDQAWRVATHRVVVGGIAARFDEIGAHHDAPDDTAESVHLGLAVPAMSYGAGDGGADLRAIGSFLFDHAAAGPHRDTWIDVLDTAAGIVDAMAEADARDRCALMRRFDLQIRRVFPHDSGTRFFEHPGHHLSRPPLRSEVSPAVGHLASDAIVLDAEYPALARFLTRLRARREHAGNRAELRLDEALTAYIDAAGQTRARDVIETSRLRTHLVSAGVAPAASLAAAITASFIQSADAGFVVNALHTSGLGLVARHVDRRSPVHETLSAFARSTAPRAVVHQFTCWDDWLSTQAVGVSGLPALRLPGDLTGPGDHRRPLSDFVVSVDSAGTIDVRCGDTRRPAAFCYTGVVPYALLSGFPRLVALVSTPWLVRRDPARGAPGEMLRAHRTLPCDASAGTLVRSDIVHTALATTTWLGDAGVGEEFFVTVVSADGTRSKPQWCSQLSPTCLAELARSADAERTVALEVVDCFPPRTDEPVHEFVLTHRIEVVR